MTTTESEELRISVTERKNGSESAEISQIDRIEGKLDDLARMFRKLYRLFEEVD